MLDFLVISTRVKKNDGVIEIYPHFNILKHDDLMIQGGDFYAVWVEERKLWSTDEGDAIMLIDRELDSFADNAKNSFSSPIRVLHMWDSKSGMIDDWHKYCQRQMRDSFHLLDEQLTFMNTVTKKTDYVSKRLPYPLEPCAIDGYDKLMSVLYSEEERHKIEWAIGSIITGDSRYNQKFMVLYGAAGTGKSTVLNIIQQLFKNYYSVFDAKSLGSANASFALEPFCNHPLVAIQHDGDLSRLEDNTRINSVVSHEMMSVNAKYKSAYPSRFKCFLFMGTNKPVKITDAKSGIMRRLIDVSPSGNKLNSKEYHSIMNNISFELGGIACHCRDVYLENPQAYDDYIPINMLGASNDFYNFIEDSYSVFSEGEGITMRAAWDMYKTYCDDAKINYPFSQRVFKEELKNYFEEYKDRYTLDDGTRVRSYYIGFKTNKFNCKVIKNKPEESEPITFPILNCTESIFDDVCKDYIAQYASNAGTPKKPWDKVKTKLSDIDTTKEHFVLFPEGDSSHIIMDFDFKDSEGNKSLDRNLKEASVWPPTYAEVSKSGGGLHLHYLYTGNPALLERIYAPNIEIKVYTGKSALRRKLTRCNDLPIATISSGLPTKGETMVNEKVIKSERGIRNLIERNLNKEIHPYTKPSICFIHDILEEAYNNGIVYDVSNMKPRIISFASKSSNNSEACLKIVSDMKFKSEEELEPTDNSNDKIVMFDTEVYPNLFVLCWKLYNKDVPVIRMINPNPEDVEKVVKSFSLIGFNCRRYDNHILYARMMGYNNEQLYKLSQKIVNGDKNCFFREAYNLSYTDVYDFADASNKKSLKKFEIELGIHHQEMSIPWDQPVPEDMWEKVADYCCNDVIATEAVFNHLKGPWTARQILADLAGMPVNTTTNTLTTRFLIGNDKHPQSQFNYRNLANPVPKLDDESLKFLQKVKPEMVAMPHRGWNNGEESVLPYFPGYKHEYGKSTYRGEDVGEGGVAQGFPGIYYNVTLDDIASMHPNSIIAEILLGLVYTIRFLEIVDSRVYIKHKEWENVENMLDGRLKPYIEKVRLGELASKDLANALKTAINSLYGLTVASFDNPFRDPRNKDNIVAKRGALFMIDLKNKVLDSNFKVAHIKTDSIKIPNATNDIINEVYNFGKRYGYTFEHEATYDRMCLVNDAVYIARYKSAEACKEMYGYIPGDNQEHGGEWTATGTQFQVPYVFKTLFSKEPIEFEDLCETKSVSTALYLDMNENLPDVTKYEKEFTKAEHDYKKGYLSDITFEQTCADLKTKIAEGHDYHFVGRVGSFCPMKPGCGGGILVREKDGKYNAASGTKNYRWMEAEMVKTLHKEDDIDLSYYNKLANDAIDTISQYGNFDDFISEEECDMSLGANDGDVPLSFMNLPE